MNIPDPTYSRMIMVDVPALFLPEVATLRQCDDLRLQMPIQWDVDSTEPYSSI